MSSIGALLLASVRIGLAPAVSVGALQVPSQDSLPSLSGTVRVEDAPDGEEGLLPGAVIEIRQGLGVRRARVGEDGAYRFPDLRPGEAELDVFHYATRPFEVRVELPSRGEIRLDLRLRRRVIPVAGIRVRAVPSVAEIVDPEPPTPTARAMIGLRSLDASSGLAESGLASALSVEEPGEPGAVLYTRGSTVDARLVLLDGAPILTPFHVAGLVEPFDLRLLRSAQLYLGGAPSSYPGGVSYLLDVRTRPARRDRASLSVGADGLTLDILAEAPLPLEGSVLAGGRVLHGLQQSLDGSSAFPYRYHDLLVRVGASPHPGHDLRATAFENLEGVRLDLGPGGQPAGAHAIWGNRAVSLGYRGRAGETALDANVAASRYESRLPIRWEDPIIAGGTGDRVRATAGGSLVAGAGSIRAGVSLERSSYRYRLYEIGLAQGPLEGSEELAVGATEVGAFSEWEHPLTPELDLRAGIRADRYSHERRVRVSPRLGLRWALGEDVELFAAAGRYHQALPAPGLHAKVGADGMTSMLAWEPALPVAAASHLVVGLEQQIDDQTHLDLTAFAKTFSGLEDGSSDRSRSSGAELRVSRDGDHLRGSFGYALSWFWVDEGPSGSTRFDGRQLLSVGIEGTIPRGIELRGTVGYGAGLPLTAIGLPSQGEEVAAPGDFEGPTSERPLTLTDSGGGAPLGLAPEGDFLRLDLEVSWPFSPSLGGRTTELRPYLRILNALNRRDALFYYFDEWHEDTSRPLSSRPFLPLVGLRWRL